MRHKIWGLLAVAGIGVLTGCSSESAAVSAPAAPVVSTVEVRYEVDFETTLPRLVRGTPSADITFETPTGTQQQSVSLPLTAKSTGAEGLRMNFRAGQFLYMSAQKDDNYGTVTCRIYVDEVLISKNSSSGDYAIATCTGRS